MQAPATPTLLPPQAQLALPDGALIQTAMLAFSWKASCFLQLFSFEVSILVAPANQSGYCRFLRKQRTYKPIIGAFYESHNPSNTERAIKRALKAPFFSRGHFSV
jgi:hypothetical protein